MAIASENEWEVGDIVYVVDEPYRESKASWVSEMDLCCGYEVEITYKSWRSLKCYYSYHVKPTNQNLDIDFDWNFCGNCFQLTTSDFEPAEEFDVISLLGG